MQMERRQLSTADERRETVLRTAIGAFAARGYFGTTTTEVAKAAGISQAYVYRLFPNKEVLFTAVVEHCFVRVRAALEVGAAKAESSAPEAVLTSMGDAYARLISDNDLMLVQLHAQAAAVSVRRSGRRCAPGTPEPSNTSEAPREAARSRCSSSSPPACSVTCWSPSTPRPFPHPGPAL